MKMLVLGAGGVGGYFGGRLVSAGVDVQFLVRPARAEVLARNGLVITSPLGDIRVPIATTTKATTPFDAILLACKAYDLDAAIEAIAPGVGPSTLILPLLNGVRHLDSLDARFGRDRVLGGLCHIGVTMTDNGEIQHLNKLERFVFGHRTPQQIEAARALHQVLERGGFAPVLSDAIMQELWEKFTFLTTYAGMTTLMRAPIGAIMSADEGESISHEMLNECVATAAANGHSPRSDEMSYMVSSLTERGSKGTASMLRDMVRNNATEHEHIIGDMLARARAAQVPAPLLRIALANMQSYEAMRLEHV
ncbi:MAG: ketopantoate reductase family protein [Hyphomicrobiaceae bacterium]